MPVPLADESRFGLHLLRASNKLSIRFLPSGCIYAIECRDILINQVLASPAAGGIHRIYLREHGDDRISFTEIVGPGAASAVEFGGEQVLWSGRWRDVQYRCTCRLDSCGGGGAGWFFDVEVQNNSPRAVRLDAILVQDLGLAARNAVRNNEAFTSQYLDHSVIRHPQAGWVLMTRQNLPQANQTHPWLLQGCLPAARGFTTDGFEFFGAACKADGVPAALSRPIIGERVRQYEAGYTALQSADVELPPSASQHWTFFAHFLADHPAASSSQDLDRVSLLPTMRNNVHVAHADRPSAGAAPIRSIFQASTFFSADDFAAADLDKYFGTKRRHEEVQDGQIIAFFYGDDAHHVVLKAKELAAIRGHGQIMRAGRGLLPDAELMCCTCWAAGVFASQLTLGNSSLSSLLSRVRDPMNIVRSSGLRIFVRAQSTEAWQLLGVPSAFEMAPVECRWHYKRGESLLTVNCIAATDFPAFQVAIDVVGEPVELLICGEIAAGPAEYESSPRMEIDRATGRITIRPDPDSLLGRKQPGLVFNVEISGAVDAIGGDELLFEDHQPRGLPYFTVQASRSGSLALKITGQAGGVGAPAFAPTIPTVRIAIPRLPEQGAQMQDCLAWFAHNALIHLSTPRGLEQSSGGAWGVRDVCQGPVEFLLSRDRADVVAEILRRLFAQQYAERGDWPQWFMFPPSQEIQSPQSHGDVLIWPLKALCDYLEDSNDATILSQRLAYTDERTFEKTELHETLLEHVDRLLEKMRQEFLPGLSLPRYGEGDWDDSLQPADPALRERMVSSWTVELMYQTLQRYAVAMEHFGEVERATNARRMAADIEADFHRHLMPDGIVAGLAIFGNHLKPEIEYLLHPRDARTGLRYRLIAMTRGILSGIFTREEAHRHLQLIREHLLFSDGARLMDRPTIYHGGVEKTFRRAESAAFFGREIGLQYVHAHLRYAEALAAMGHAGELWRALLVANPIAVTDVVPSARPRQRNCYFSSSDAAFADRYQASRDYQKLRLGDVSVEGGWRVYSSGPGIYSSLVIRQLFGLRRSFDFLEFDPVLPREFDGASIELVQDGRQVRYQFGVRDGECSPTRIVLNGKPIAAQRVNNAYRGGGLRVLRGDFAAGMSGGVNLVQIQL